jgi:predicted nucleic acid-binding protein
VILVDTNVLVAAGNTAETDHSQARELLEAVQDDLLVVPMVVAEVCHLVGTRDRGGPAAEAAFLRTIAAGQLQLTTMTTADVGRMAQLVEQYADLGLGGTDASLVAIAERLGIDQVATFDRRHFTVVRPRHVDTLTLLPL